MPIREIMNTEFGEGGQHFSLGIDEKARLYVNGELVVTQQRVRLQWWINVALFVGAAGSLTQGVFAGLTYFFK